MKNIKLGKLGIYQIYNYFVTFKIEVSHLLFWLRVCSLIERVKRSIKPCDHKLESWEITTSMTDKKMIRNIVYVKKRTLELCKVDNHKTSQSDPRITTTVTKILCYVSKFVNWMFIKNIVAGKYLNFKKHIRENSKKKGKINISIECLIHC